MFMGPASDVGTAIKAWKAEGGKRTEALAVLVDLARTAFVPMSSDHKLARLLTEFNVCAFVPNQGRHCVPCPELVERDMLGPCSSLPADAILIASELVSEGMELMAVR
jgi:hypothetical protein